MTTVIVEGKLTGKGRPRVCKHGTYTPKETKDYEQIVRNAYMDQNGIYFEEDIPVQVNIKAYKKPPKSTTKRDLKLIEQGVKAFTKKVDIDNIIKIILDALNGLAYKDDGQVIKIKASKEYTLQKERVEFEVKEVKK